MLTVTRVNECRLDIELNGKLDAEQMDAGLNDLIDKAVDIVNGKMLYTLTSFEMPSMKALAVEFKRLPSLFGLIRNFDKVAVLAEQEWVQKISEVEALLIPGLDIKVFDLVDVSGAEAWLNQDDMPSI